MNLFFLQHNLHSMPLKPFLIQLLLVEELRDLLLEDLQEEALQLPREEVLLLLQVEDHQVGELLHLLEEDHHQKEEALQLLLVGGHQVEELLHPLQEDHQHQYLEVHQLLLVEDHLAEDNLAEDRQEEVIRHLLFRI